MGMSTNNRWITCREQFLKHTIPAFHGRLALALAVPEEILWTFVLLSLQGVDDLWRERAVHRGARLLRVEKELVVVQSRTFEAGGILDA